MARKAIVALGGTLNTLLSTSTSLILARAFTLAPAGIEVFFFGLQSLAAPSKDNAGRFCHPVVAMLTPLPTTHGKNDHI